MPCNYLQYNQDDKPDQPMILSSQPPQPQTADKLKFNNLPNSIFDITIIHALVL